ncbi:MAG: 1-acyl-sn-glycerol-3-phosphate acyltransferase [Polyangiaceae bacterium]
MSRFARLLEGALRSVNGAADLVGAGPPIDRLFEQLRVDEAWAPRLRELSEKGPIVFVLRALSGVDALALAHLASRWHLPEVGYAHDLPAFPLALLRTRVRAPFQPSLAQALAVGRTAILFLKRPPALFSTTGRGQTEGDALLEVALEWVRETGKDIALVPVTILWSLKPERQGLTSFDAIFGPTDMPGELRSFAQLVTSFSQGAVRFGEPLMARAFLEAQAPDAAPYTLIRRLTYALLFKVERERRAVVGPAHKTPDRIREQVLSSPKLATLMRELSGGDPDKRAEVEASARKMLDDLSASPNPDMVRAIEPVADALVRKVFSGVDVSGIDALHEAAVRGTVVLLPCHKSHVDYLVISYVLRKNLLELPVIAAGDNLAFFPVGGLLRRGGAFFIRRDARTDRLYAAVLDAYVRRLLRDGWPIEFFLEGGRSRTGKMLSPKVGLLNLVVDAATSLDDHPTFFVPVHLGYERLMEDFELSQERAGAKKERESTRSLLAVADALKDPYGRVAVSFGTPIALHELRASMGLAESTLSPAKRRSLTTRLASAVVAGIHQGALLTAGALTATALLDMRERGISQRDLVGRVEMLLTVGRRGGARPAPSLVDDAGRVRPDAVREAAIVHARGGLVKEHVSDEELDRAAATKGPARAVERRLEGSVVYTVPEEGRGRLDLAKNAILHFFVDRALVSVAYRALRKRSVPRPEVRAAVVELATWLAQDLVCLAHPPFAERVDAVLDDMLAFGELRAAADGALEVGGGNSDADASTWLESHAAHLTPALESYRVSARAARILSRSGPLSEGELVARALTLGREMFLRGELERRESVSAPTMSAAFDAMVERGLLRKQGGKFELANGKTDDDARAVERYFRSRAAAPFSGEPS